MRTSPPWLQHRDLNICHDVSHYPLQTCLIHNSAPHPTNARSFVVLVTSPLCHHHQTTLRSLSRFQSVPIGNGWMGTHRIRFSSISRGSLSARNSHSFLQAFDLFSRLIQLGIPAVSIRKLPKHLLHVAILSGPLFVEGLVDAIAIPKLGCVQVVITTCNPIEKLTPYRIFTATRGLVLTRWQNGPVRTVPMYLDSTAYSISPSAATADLWNTVRDSLSSLSRGRCSRMLLKVMPFVFFKLWFFSVTCTTSSW